MLLQTTTSAKSGQRRASPLTYFRSDGKLVITECPRRRLGQSDLGAQPTGTRRDRGSKRPTGRRANCRFRSVTRASRKLPLPHRDSQTAESRPVKWSRC
ncbi:hypothetical protein [Mycobacterium lepromatosis]|uniref:hypothetical protein n=1 Tax=Mycobacterium lepromatosis TaxID=480418 RepID=UPI000AC11D28